MIRADFLLYILLVLLVTINPLYAQESIDKGNIEVTIQDINTEEHGNLVILLFNSEDSWLTADQSYKVIIIDVLNKTEKIVFEDVPFGTNYAIEVIHDENGNFKMDMRILPYPKPKEGVGLSNNTFRAGPPEYEKARFQLDKAVVSLNIVMNY